MHITNHGTHKGTTIFKISKNPKIYKMTYSVVKNYEIINRIQVNGKTIKEVKTNYDLIERSTK